MASEASGLWGKLSNEIEREGDDWQEFCADEFGRMEVNILRMAASALGLETAGTQEELAARLTEADCFLGPIGDDTIYQHREDGDVPMVGMRGIPGYQSWQYIASSNDTKSGGSE